MIECKHFKKEITGEKRILNVLCQKSLPLGINS